MNLTSIENGIKKAAHDLKVAGEAILGAATKIQGEATVIEPIANQLVASVDPAAATVAETGEALLAKVITAIQAAGPAAAAKGLTVTLDETVIADVTAIGKAIKAL